MARIRHIASVMLRAGERDFEAGTELPWADAEGKDRNLWTARIKGWFSRTELEEVNHLLARLVNLFAGASSTEDSRLVTLTWVLAPVEDRPVRRGAKEKGGEGKD